MPGGITDCMHYVHCFRRFLFQQLNLQVLQAEKNTVRHALAALVSLYTKIWPSVFQIGNVDIASTVKASGMSSKKCHSAS